MKSYDEIYQNVLRRRDEQMAKKRRRIAIAGSTVLPAVMLSAAVVVGAAAWQSAPAAENPLAQDSQNESVAIEVVDGRAVVSKCSLGGYTAELELTDITQEPTVEENYYYTNSISVRVTDPNGKVAETVLSYCPDRDKWASADVPGVEINGDGSNHHWQQFLVQLPADHIGESLKLYELDDNGTKHYVLALRKYYEDNYFPHELSYCYSTLFFSCEDYSFDSGVLNLYTWLVDDDKSGLDDYTGSYSALTTDDMRVSGTSIINDGAVDLGYWAADVYEFEPADRSFTHDQVPQLGGDAIVSTDEGIGYSACLRLNGLTHVPEEGADYYTAEEAMVTVVDFNNGTKATVSLNDTGLTYEHFVKDIKWEAVDEGNCVKSGVRLLPIEFEGKQHYVLAVQHYLSDMDTDLTTFYACEPDCFNAGILYPYFGKEFGNQLLFSVNGNLRLLEGNTYIEGNENYEGYIRFDPVSKTATNGALTCTLNDISEYGYTASYELQYMTHCAQWLGEGIESPDAYWAGEDAVIKVTDPEGRTASVSVKAANDIYGDFFYNNINGDHIDESMKIYRIEQDGEAHYVLALRNYYLFDAETYGEESEGFFTLFFALEPECFENGVLRLYESGTPNRHTSNFIIFASGDLSVDGNSLVDTATDTSTAHFYDFDPENFLYRWHYE